MVWMTHGSRVHLSLNSYRPPSPFPPCFLLEVSWAMTAPPSLFFFSTFFFSDASRMARALLFCRHLLSVDHSLPLPSSLKPENHILSFFREREP